VPGIVNPAKLDAARRDSVCAQCHLVGAARIARARARQGAYRPGARLSDYSAFFVWAGAGSSALNVNSHFEKLQQSACKQASADLLWCGTCHDPHTEPAAAARTEYYRARCEKCHQPSACREQQAARQKAQNDCVACHMPKSPVRDNLHAVYTDHSIPRRLRQPATTGDKTLVPFWNTPPDGRDLGLAYAAVANSDPALEQRALELLERAAEHDPADLPVLAQLAQIYDRTGQEKKAMALDEKIVRSDPAQITASVNLGTYWVRRGRATEAMRLWQDSLVRNPGLTEVRMNLAVTQYQAGDRAAAIASLQKALEYDPDHALARKLLAEISTAQP